MQDFWIKTILRNWNLPLSKMIPNYYVGIKEFIVNMSETSEGFPGCFTQAVFM